MRAKSKFPQMAEGHKQTLDAQFKIERNVNEAHHRPAPAHRPFSRAAIAREPAAGGRG